VWLEGEWWRVATAPFLHGSVLHLVLNLWSLWVLNDWAESAWGRGGALGLFLLCAVGGCLGSLAWAEADLVVGASGGVMGVAGSLWAIKAFRDDRALELQDLVVAHLGWTIGVIIALGAFLPVVAQAGHVAGLMTGLGLAWCTRRPRLPRRWAIVLGAALLAVAAAARPTYRANYFMIVGIRHLELRELNRSSSAFERGLELMPRDPDFQNALAYTLALVGEDLVRAQQLAESALVSKPGDPDVLDTLGWIACRSGRVIDGQLLIRRALETVEAEDAVELWAHIAMCSIAPLF